MRRAACGGRGLARGIGHPSQTHPSSDSRRYRTGDPRAGLWIAAGEPAGGFRLLIKEKMPPPEDQHAHEVQDQRRAVSEGVVALQPRE